MNWRNVIVVYLKELTDSLRDRRTLLSVIIVPTLVMPALAFVVGRIATKVVAGARHEKPAIMVIGAAEAPGLATALAQSSKFRVVPARDDYQRQIVDKTLRAVVRIPPGFERDLEGNAAPPVAILHYEGEIKSGFAAAELERFLREYRDRRVADVLAARALPATLVRPFEVKRENVAPPEKVGGNLFGGIVPYLIIVLCFAGAMYPAIDLAAGEKERGTMETLLCSPASRVEIVLGKFLMVLTGSLSAMVLSLLSMGATAIAMGLMLTGGGAPAVAAAARGGPLPMIDPVGLLGVLAMVFPVAVLFSAVELTVALFARTSKEAQSYLGPLILVVLLPAVIGMLPGIELNARLALVPLLNLSLVCRELLSGVWHWHYIGLIFASSCLYAAAALALAVRMFNREAVMFRT